MSREAFEAWYDRYFTEACERFGGIDCSDPKGLAEAAWQAAQDDTFERAAKVCKDQWYAADCADAIRALAKEEVKP